MAMRALTAAIAGRRVAGQNGLPALASCRRGGGGGGAQSDTSRRSAHTQAAVEHDAVTAEQVEAALNSKNVDGVELQDHQGASRAATMRLPDEVVDDADAAWVPDQDTGVFVPAEEAAAASNSGATHDAPAPAATESVLDQTVFVREEEMQDVERPAVDMDNGDAAK